MKGRGEAWEDVTVQRQRSVADNRPAPLAQCRLLGASSSSWKGTAGGERMCVSLSLACSVLVELSLLSCSSAALRPAIKVPGLIME